MMPPSILKSISGQAVKPGIADQHNSNFMFLLLLLIVFGVCVCVSFCFVLFCFVIFCIVGVFLVVLHFYVF